MNRLAKLFSTAALSLGLLGTSAATVIGFDDIGTRNNFDNLGISGNYQGFHWTDSTGFGNSDGWASATTSYRVLNETLTPASGNGYAWNWNGLQSLFIDFGSATDVTGAFFANGIYGGHNPGSEASTIQMFGYDALGNLVASSGILGLNTGFQFLGAGFNDIFRLEFRAEAAGRWFMIDDLIINESVPVPAPAGLGLFALGLLAARRRKAA